MERNVDFAGSRRTKSASYDSKSMYLTKINCKDGVKSSNSVTSKTRLRRPVLPLLFGVAFLGVAAVQTSPDLPVHGLTPTLWERLQAADADKAAIISVSKTMDFMLNEITASRDRKLMARVLPALASKDRLRSMMMRSLYGSRACF